MRSASSEQNSIRSSARSTASRAALTSPSREPQYLGVLGGPLQVPAGCRALVPRQLELGVAQAGVELRAA